MKYFAVLLLLTAAMWAENKPYHDLPITVLASHVDAGGILKIEAADKDGILRVRLVFTCDTKNVKCAAPILSPEVYWLTQDSTTPRCDGYIIDKGHEPIVRACLQSSTKR